MKAIDLLQTYPKAAEVIREWFFNQMVSSLKEDPTIPEDYRKAMIAEGVTDERLAVFIDVQPRALFDVFDENNIHINIATVTNEIDTRFVGSINRYEEKYYCFERKALEAIVIEESFKILDQNLIGLLALEEPHAVEPPDYLKDEATGL